MISVLTEPDRFNGNFADLDEVRDEVNQPVLCKDFIIDPIQITAARSQCRCGSTDAVRSDDHDHGASAPSALGMDVLTS